MEQFIADVVFLTLSLVLEEEGESVKMVVERPNPQTTSLLLRSLFCIA